MPTGIEPFSATVAEHYADIYAELSARGALIPHNDMAVAAGRLGPLQARTGHCGQGHLRARRARSQAGIHARTVERHARD